MTLRPSSALATLPVTLCWTQPELQAKNQPPKKVKLSANRLLRKSAQKLIHTVLRKSGQSPKKLLAKMPEGSATKAAISSCEKGPTRCSEEVLISSSEKVSQGSSENVFKSSCEVRRDGQGLLRKPAKSSSEGVPKSVASMVTSNDIWKHTARKPQTYQFELTMVQCLVKKRKRREEEEEEEKEEEEEEEEEGGGRKKRLGKKRCNHEMENEWSLLSKEARKESMKVCLCVCVRPQRQQSVESTPLKLAARLKTYKVAR